MPGEYNEDGLQKLRKPQLIALVLSQRDETKATADFLRDEEKTVKENFRKT